MLFNTCFIVLVVQQPQRSPLKPPEGNSQQGWEEQGGFPGPEGSPAPLQDRLHSLAEAERLLDELTREKMQVGRVQCGQAAHPTTYTQRLLHERDPSLVNDGGLSFSLKTDILVAWSVRLCRSRQL